ncbi:MAG: dTMP kinase [Dehalococcoidia bacterium]|nr:dTMP kinase [Dehalococcoidia bacterium]
MTSLRSVLGSSQALAPVRLNAPGLFVALEGIDGAGKTTQADRLAEKLRIRWPSRQVLLLHEPGSTGLGERIRRLVKEEQGTTIDPIAELLLFAAARAQLVSEVIAPTLSAGGVVLCDRFTASTRAYQGAGRGIEMHLIDQVESVATGGIRPDLTILFDLNIETALARRSTALKDDRFERQEIAFYQRVRAGYLDAAQEQPGRWLVVDGGPGAREVTTAMWGQIEQLLDF